MFVGRYAIYYKTRDDEIAIVRVLHGARDVVALAEHPSGEARSIRIRAAMFSLVQGKKQGR